MNLPQSLYRRLLLALLLAVLAVVGLAFAVEALDDGPGRTLRAQPAPEAPPGAAPAFELLLPRHRDTLGFELRPLVGTLAVAAHLSALPPDVAPVVEVLADGSLALRRPRPLAVGPGATARRSLGGDGAGLVLPAAGLEGLSAEARGALGGLLAGWFPARPLPRERLRPVDLELPDAALDRLLRWLP